MKKYAVIFILLFSVFGAFAQSKEQSYNEILQHGDWKSKVESNTLEVGSFHEILDQSYEYNFFTTDRFAIFTFREEADESDEDLYHLYFNFRVYGTYEISGNQIKFHFEPEKTYCFLQDKLTPSEYDRLIQTFIQDFIGDFNIIKSLDNNRLILKNPRTGKTRSFNHALPFVTQ